MGRAERSQCSSPGYRNSGYVNPVSALLLVKRADERGFCFFTNAESRKGGGVEREPQGGSLFSLEVATPAGARRGAGARKWKKQMWTPTSTAAPASSQIGAAVSQQSRPLGSWEELETKFRRFSEEHPGEVPRPPYWRGFCIRAERIEFWMNGENRLHQRYVFTREADHWIRTRLYP